MKRTNKIKAYLARASGAGVCIELRGSGSHSV